MKILGITAGRKTGNCEIILKEAFMAAEAMGTEVEMVNLHDCSIIPCTGCESCTMKIMKGMKPYCIHKGKDDMDLIMDSFLKADGIILSIPSFVLQTQGIFKVFVDRWLPYEIALLLESGIIDKEPERVAGVIAVGGSTQSWQTMTLPALRAAMFMQSIKVVDQMMATQVARPGQIILKPDMLERAAELGRNVVKAMKTPYDKVEWLGEEGWCPECHSNLMIQGKPQWDGTSYDVECAVCGTGGSFAIEGGRTVFKIAENGLEHCRLYSDKRNNHFHELQETHGEAFRNMDRIKEGMARYKQYEVSNIKER
ncbi:MAG: flavodoxin family protein [Clostridiales bacterium]|nr:flavodoxin family protein [Clostridiales bacterium]